MNNLIGRSALATVAVFALAACGGTPATSTAPSARPGTSLPAGATPSAAAPSAPAASTSAATPASDPSMAPIFSNHSDPALEALLPATVSGTTMLRYSLTLTQVLDAGGDRLGITTFLQSINKTEADGSFAAAIDPTNVLGGGIAAYKVVGADAAALLAGITALEQADLGTGATIEPATVGGKNVTVMSVGDGVNDTEWIYGYGDVVFAVHAPDEAQAAAFLAALP